MSRPVALGRVLHRRALLQELRVVLVMLVVVMLQVLDVLVAQEAGLVRRTQNPCPHPVSDHNLVLLLGDSLQGVSRLQIVSDKLPAVSGLNVTEQMGLEGLT
jgi:hypothetical protein